MKAVFCGTPDFALKSLDSLLSAGIEVVLVVTQPDKKRGRGKEVSFSPVKLRALERNIPVFQPVKLREKEAVDRLREVEADVCIVAAFGQILPKEILEMYRYGCINVHGSLLPKLRGAAPVQWAIIEGHDKTGITIMQMDQGVDTGDILFQRELDIAPGDTGDSLFDRMAALGGEALVEALALLEQGRLIPQKQQEDKASYVKMLNKSDGELNFEDSAVSLERRIRGLNSWPGAYTFLDGRILKIWMGHVADPVGQYDVYADCPVGTVVKAKKELIVKCGQGFISFDTLQLEGRKSMDVKDFLRGCNIQEGIIIGRES